MAEKRGSVIQSIRKWLTVGESTRQRAASRNLDKSATSPISVMDPRWIMHATKRARTTKKQKGSGLWRVRCSKLLLDLRRSAKLRRSLARCIKCARAWHLARLKPRVRICYLRTVRHPTIELSRPVVSWNSFQWISSRNSPPPEFLHVVS